MQKLNVMVSHMFCCSYLQGGLYIVAGKMFIDSFNMCQIS